MKATPIQIDINADKLIGAMNRLSEQLYYADILRMDRKTFELRHTRLLAEGELGKARRLEEDFERQKEETQEG